MTVTFISSPVSRVSIHQPRFSILVLQTKDHLSIMSDNLHLQPLYLCPLYDPARILKLHITLPRNLLQLPFLLKVTPQLSQLDQENVRSIDDGFLRFIAFLCLNSQHHVMFKRMRYSVRSEQHTIIVKKLSDISMCSQEGNEGRLTLGACCPEYGLLFQMLLLRRSGSWYPAQGGPYDSK
jgi:hypothetical protein